MPVEQILEDISPVFQSLVSRPITSSMLGTPSFKKVNKTLQQQLDLPKAITLFSREGFITAFRNEYAALSDAEASNIYDILLSTVNTGEFSGLGLPALIYAFAKQHLYLSGNELLCCHEDFVLWREAVHGIGQTLFICSFLAGQDAASGYSRRQFDFSPYLKTDDFRLRQVLSYGVAENHFHLNGSSPAFLMNWTCLMNHTENREAEFQKLTEMLNTSGKYLKDYDIKELVRIAAGLRAYIWHLIINDETDYPSDFNMSNKAIHDNNKTDIAGFLEHYGGNLQKYINWLRFTYTSSLDYTLNTQSSSKPYAPISGENYFLYRVFLELYLGKNQMLLQNIDCFYAYLLIYCRMRSELVQDNNAVGFGNFKKYQDRKETFINKKLYATNSEAFTKMAFESALDNVGLVSLEARIIPPKKTNDLAEKIESILNTLTPPTQDVCKTCEHYNNPQVCDTSRIKRCHKKIRKLLLVMHIPKKKDDPLTESNDYIKGYLRCRHDRYRREQVDASINSIITLRNTCRHLAKYIYAIDACSTEIGCRPEVFAPAFRRARKSCSSDENSLNAEKLPPLHITYHVGEDFLDIVDGLRAIDEAIQFLELKNSDRLGHALALGILAEDFYTSKANKVFISRQDLMDNAAWFYMTLQRFNINLPDLFFDLREIFREQYNVVYAENLPFQDKDHIPTLEMYFDSWLLRGDEPKYYLNISEQQGFLQNLKTAPSGISYPLGALQDNNVINRIREQNIVARKLYNHYHYNPKVKKAGEERYEFLIKPRYIHAVGFLQRAMQQHIACLGIGIECNPSSNYLIGTFKDYANHPIFVFNNDGLDCKIDSAQIMVSVNTDDQGIFDTDLENEYALLASALKCKTDEHGIRLHIPANIYRYIDNVRKMGLEQSFKHLDKNLTGGGYHDK